ncbi:rho guanine nucleotide exchange factor 10 isoform X3 [Bemisia tabaci]|uniref:rho guanine nucleotide exchange factor 10 isoform X3 n=1 Tax=Bemisia tabaci TaxID=7038 RepID=UPI003B285606
MSSSSSHYPPARRPFLKFPPPPPFPPGTHTDYAYAYYEPGPSTSKHTFINCYGTEENIYEEIGATQLEQEVRYVHSKHLQVLDELNLTVEAMLMPPPTSSSKHGHGGDGADGNSGGSGSGGSGGSGSGGPGDDLLSPASCSLDSGFSGSSSGTNSLSRNSTPNSSAMAKYKKSPQKFWKKIPNLVSPSSSSSTLTKNSDEPRCVSTSWEECARGYQSQRSSCSDPEYSSGDESIKSNENRGTVKSNRSLWRRNSPSPDPAGPPPPSGRLYRWFSIRRGSQYELEPKERSGKMPLLPEVEEESFLNHRRLLPPALPPPPPHLSPQELKRRLIVGAIVHSENSYHATLERLVNDYKKPLEEASPQILSSSKISMLFCRVPELLQCHTLFRIALAEAVANWDRDHRIGDVFVASFSKSIVLEIYSGFINNFSVAMDLARSETKRKANFAEFLRTRQVNSHDRLSFFGLMVKPVQRFPQFILLLQDLLHHTGQGHPDRMSLQLALTQLESLAELLNERKRESEQSLAFKEMLRAISGKLSTRPMSADNNRCLLRQDDVTQLDVNQCGLVSKCKPRRLLLLNDFLVCVSVTPSGKEDVNSPPSLSNQRLSLKWSCPITEVQVVENASSPTLNRLLTPSGSLSSNSSGVTDNLCVEMSQLMHDYQVVSRISDLVATLKGTYPDLNADSTRVLLNSIQCEIQRKDEQMAWVDSCCLQLSIQNKQNYTFQMDSPEIRKEWITELRLARLALDPNNSPAWEIPESEQRPSTKMPLFVGALPLTSSLQQSEVTCGCFYTSSCGKSSYLWVCTVDGTNSHVTVIQASPGSTNFKQVTTLDLVNTRVTAMEHNRAADTVWIGTDSSRVLVYSVFDMVEVGSIALPNNASVVIIKQHCDSMFLALSNGSLLLYRRANYQSSEPETIVLGPDQPVSSLLPINLSLYAACGKQVTVLNAITGEIQKSFTIQHEHIGGNVNLMAYSGVGLWLSLANSTTICLYHTETFKHLQDINVASNILRLTGNSGPVCVTALMACKGLLWVGTDAGISLTVPLPRLEGVPIISGRVNVSYHAHTGPVKLLLALQDPPTILKRPPSKALACDIYGLYGQLMCVNKYYEEETDQLNLSSWSLSNASSNDSTETSAPPNHRNIIIDNSSKRESTLVTITGGTGYVNYQQPCCSTVEHNSHIILWELKL